MICIQCDDRVKRGVQFAQDGVESLDLGGVARIAIENPAVLGVVHGQTVLDDLVGQLVRHKLALVDVLERFDAELGLVLDVVAEDIAGGDRRDSVVLAQQSGLGALAYALRAHDQQSHVLFSVSFIPLNGDFRMMDYLT